MPNPTYPSPIHPAPTNLTYRKLIATVAVTLALLGGSFGVAKSASAAVPERPAAVPTLQEHFAHLEVDSGEVRTPMKVLNWATARPVGRTTSRHSAEDGAPTSDPRGPSMQTPHQIS
jgi:hypothetical protein